MAAIFCCHRYWQVPWWKLRTKLPILKVMN
jgi:hypothetical protein